MNGKYEKEWMKLKETVKKLLVTQFSPLFKRSYVEGMDKKRTWKGRISKKWF